MNIWKVFILILVFVATASLGLFVYYSQPKKMTPVVLGSNSIEAIPTVTESLNEEVVSNSSLKIAVEKALEGTKGTYGIVVKNLKTGETFFQNEKMVFNTASLYKIWIMATVYKQIESGVLTEDQELSEDVESLNKKFQIAEENAELKEGVVTFTVYEALKQMITISHNYAAMILTAKIRLSNVAAFLKENNLNDSTVGTSGGLPTSTPADIALFFEKLYKGELAGKDNTDKMIGLLKQQQLNDGLPKYLPENIEIANKTGEMDSFKHDAGIVFLESGDYIIVAMSKSDAPLAAEERIAEVSKAVFNYFDK